MIVERSVEEVRRALQGRGRIGFVPTMGALHDGHLSLVDIARTNSDFVVVSIFVNPLQFGPAEDLASYPRDESGDLQSLEKRGADLVFLPSKEVMYPRGAETTVHVGGLGDVLEGSERPGHFDGVATVVTKLFNIVKPDVAIFGQKDAQQVAVIKKVIGDLDIDVEIIVGPTIRASDGLALSSRNAYLDEEERRLAPALRSALEEGKEALRAGDSPETAASVVRALLSGTPGVRLGYAEAVDPVTFGPPSHGRDVLLVVAARLGSTRLIDNLLVEGDEK